MKKSALKWLTTVPVAVALAFSLAACGGSTGSTSSGGPTDALAGSDQQSLDRYTTDDVVALDSVKKDELGLITPGTITVGTLSDAPPNIFIKDGVFTGYDNELLRAMADKLGLKVEFKSTDFSALLAQVENKSFDVGSSSISTTDARRENVGFTNGYDFGYMAVVAKTDSDIKGFADLTDKTRIAVVQGTVQDDYVTNTLKFEAVRFPDYNTAYANLKNGQVDAWVAPSQQATGQVKDGDGTVIAEEVVNTQNFTAYAVNSENKPLTDALNSALDAVIADGTWSKLTKEWYPTRPMPEDWTPGSKAVTVPKA
ncbi:polar amino acid transport system substrate-binding protein [Arthrobacter stackebrandtii]|uniref:Polar amino acid transport system substrate-binding protein n=1 Tax=Arthrobacter stackebrandtii TaxID=272161 RepID=A0ABS4YXT0_9MICC|nr:ABC transporter substrate-binding protein [Arthrobacter stackebrandtii]MBP2413619.1 polar amino acid transport system substrate-binding protein [Arthrobacter stackebrandtii]PYH00562.1 amino acid ABC transporter substrate-binding protein [Arthrobacter stackebrandtii]